MADVLKLETATDRAFAAFQSAREKAFVSGRREDAEFATRALMVFMEACLHPDDRPPRDPVTLRMLAPSEMRSRQGGAQR